MMEAGKKPALRGVRRPEGPLEYCVGRYYYGGGICKLCLRCSRRERFRYLLNESYLTRQHPWIPPQAFKNSSGKDKCPNWRPLFLLHKYYPDMAGERD